MVEFKINVHNKTGFHQRYAIFSDAPTVSGGTPASAIWPIAQATAHVPSDGTAQFRVGNQYQAMCGMTEGQPAGGVAAVISATKTVTLGTRDATGKAVPGTSVQFEVMDKTPNFSDKQLEKKSKVNAFEIATTPTFSVKDAQQDNIMIGLAVSRGGSENEIDTMPAAFFTPQPNVRYQIAPSHIWYVASADMSTGSLVDLEDLPAASLKVDFATMARSDVKIIHDDHGNFVFDTDS